MGNETRSNEGIDTSWIPIFLLMAFIPPIGVFMLIRKLIGLSRDVNRNEKKTSKSATGIGVGLIGLGLYQLVRLFTGGGFISVAISALVMVAGTSFIKKGSGSTKRNASEDSTEPTAKDGVLLKKYMYVVGDRRTVSLDEFMKKFSKSYQQVCLELTRLIALGGLGEDAYIDRKARALVLFDVDEAPVQEPIAQTPPERAQSTRPSAAASTIDQEFERKLEEMRRVNEAIKHEKVSQQIYHIEDVTASIFQLVKEQPDKRNQINTFMNYYLPTTLKLLNNYSQLERQTVMTANIRSSMANIEGLMDQLVFAFDQQLDNLFESEALDISSDIKVLERMLAKDGLSENAYTLPRQQP